MLKLRATRSRKSKGIEDIEREKINKFKDTTVSVGDTDSYPRGRKVQDGREDAIKAKGGDDSSHRRLSGSLRRGCTSGFVSSLFSHGFAQA